jgi:hypothetical protein
VPRTTRTGFGPSVSLIAAYGPADAFAIAWLECNTAMQTDVLEDTYFRAVTGFTDIPRAVVPYCWVCAMSPYGRYCQRQASECARRARLAASPDVAEHYRKLGLAWLKLAQNERIPRVLKTATEAINHTPRRSWLGILRPNFGRRQAAY